MGDPLTAVGAAAGIVQLIDVALRLSRKAYGFLSEVKDAKGEIQDLRTTLVDVEQQVCLLRNYADALAHSNVAQEEFELPVESITRFINRYLDDLQLLAATLPKNISPNLMQKLKWVYSKGKVTDITRRLQDRKADVTFTLSITGRLHDLHFRKNVEQLRETVELGTSAICGDLSYVWQSLQSIMSHPPDICSSVSFTAVSTDNLTKIFRAELQSGLTPILEQNLALEQTVAKYSNRNEAVLRSMKERIDSMSLELGQAATTLNVFQSVDDTLGQECSSELHPRMEELRDKGPRADPRPLSDMTYESQQNQLSRSPRVVSKLRQNWPFRTRIGTFNVEIIQTHTKRPGRPGQHAEFSISLHFRPSIFLSILPGVSMLYTTAPTHGRYLQIAPMIQTFPIVHWEHRIYRHIHDGQFEKVQEMINNREVSPYCENPVGNTLLHESAIWGRFEILQYLLSLGMDPQRTNVHGKDALMIILGGVLSGMIDTSYHTCIQAFRTIRSIEEAGGDLTEIETYWLSTPQRSMFQWDIYNPSNRNIASVREVVLYLLGKGRDAWGLFFKLWGKLWTQANLGMKNLLDVLFEIGLDPNFLSGNYVRPLLICALSGVSGVKTRNQEGMLTSDDGTSRNAPIWCLVELLVRKGADVYYMHLHKCADNWWDIPTPTAYAILWKVEEEWRAALRACGHDPDQVYEEDERRRKDFIKLRGAKRTGVEVEELSSPSGLGLRQRKPYQA